MTGGALDLFLWSKIIDEDEMEKNRIIKEDIIKIGIKINKYYKIYKYSDKRKLYTFIQNRCDNCDHKHCDKILVKSSNKYDNKIIDRYVFMCKDVSKYGILNVPLVDIDHDLEIAYQNYMFNKLIRIKNKI